MYLHECLNINEKGHLTIGGVDTADIAAEYSTPAYVMDEQEIRRNCMVYVNAMRRYFPSGSYPLYAGKALSFKKMYNIVQSEGMGADAVSCGEIYTAAKAGFDMDRIYFHGNNKTDSDIKMALDYKIGCFVCDNEEELCALNDESGRRGIRQKILLRVTPGIDPHTHKKIMTGGVDSKFGSSIKTGQAEKIVEKALHMKNIDLYGFHCHIGSQIFDEQPFIDAAEIVLKFADDMKKKFGFELRELNLGGGFGVKYVPEQRSLDVDRAICLLSKSIKKCCDEYGMPFPCMRLEPGRSIVASAGITLYTVGSVKEIPGMKNYVSVDGGMPDNPRYALYQSLYEACAAEKADQEKNYVCTLAGRCCESGDLLGENMKIQPVTRGDLIAVLTTGAYNYSMASNYNRIPRPPVIMVKDKKTYIAVKRESFEDLISNDV